MILPEDEQAFLCDALAQLEPDVRPVFTARMIEYLAALADPGVGDVDRALRLAWRGLWTPPLLAETKVPPRWSQASPFVRVPKARPAGRAGGVMGTPHPVPKSVPKLGFAVSFGLRNLR